MIITPDNSKNEENKESNLNFSVPALTNDSQKKTNYRHVHTFSFEPSYMHPEPDESK
jgi:hypothetical protein